MATHYPLVVDAIWALKVGEEHLLSMVQPPKGNISVASYYLAQKTAKERIYLYRNDSNVGTLTYLKHKGRWVLPKGGPHEPGRTLRVGTHRSALSRSAF